MTQRQYVFQIKTETSRAVMRKAPWTASAGRVGGKALTAGLASREGENGASARRLPSRASQTTSQFPHWALWPSLWWSSQAAHPPGRTVGHRQPVTGEKGPTSPFGLFRGLWPLFTKWFGVTTRTPPTDFLWAFPVSPSASTGSSLVAPMAWGREAGSEK